MCKKLSEAIVPCTSNDSCFCYLAEPVEDSLPVGGGAQ